MNKSLCFNEFAKFVQGNRDYYIFGTPSSVGIIEDVMAWFGIPYEIETHAETMHKSGLNKIKNFIETVATDEQTMMLYDIATNGKAVPAVNPACKASGLVFVSMPMNKEKCDCVDIIRDGIRNGVQATGNEPYFLDQDLHGSDINAKMIEQINSCKFLVADFTTHNAGVYYEAGYARGIGKTVIHTCKESDFRELHFDIKNLQAIVWSDACTLQAKLADMIHHIGLANEESH